MAIQDSFVEDSFVEDSFQEDLTSQANPVKVGIDAALFPGKALIQPLVQINRTAESGLRGIGGMAGEAARQFTPIRGERSNPSLSEIAERGRASVAGEPSVSTLESIGRFGGESMSPVNLAFGGVVGKAGKLPAATAKKFGMKEAATILEHPTEVNLLTPKTAIGEAGALRSQFLKESGARIDPTPIAHELEKVYNNLPAAATEGKAALRKTLNYFKNKGFDAVDPLRAQEELSALGEKVFQLKKGGQEISSALRQVRGAQQSAQKTLQQQVPGLAEKTENLRIKEAARPFKDIIDVNVLKALSGRGVPAGSPRLGGLALQGIGLGTKTITAPGVREASFEGLRRAFGLK